MLERERDVKVFRLEQEKGQIKWREIPEDYCKSLIRYYELQVIKNPEDKISEASSFRAKAFEILLEKVPML